jgi:hypothetical protein
VSCRALVPLGVREKAPNGCDKASPPKKIGKIGARAAPSAVAVRLRQMAWVAETAKMPPPHALRYNADLRTRVPKGRGKGGKPR